MSTLVVLFMGMGIGVGVTLISVLVVVHIVRGTVDMLFGTALHEGHEETQRW